MVVHMETRQGELGFGLFGLFVPWSSVTTSTFSTTVIPHFSPPQVNHDSRQSYFLYVTPA
jgi:hypothetical protein